MNFTTALLSMRRGHIIRRKQSNAKWILGIDNEIYLADPIKGCVHNIKDTDIQRIMDDVISDDWVYDDDIYNGKESLDIFDKQDPIEIIKYNTKNAIIPNMDARSSDRGSLEQMLANSDIKYIKFGGQTYGIIR